MIKPPIKSHNEEKKKRKKDIDGKIQMAPKEYTSIDTLSLTAYREEFRNRADT